MAGNRKSGGANVALTTRSRRSAGAWTALTTAKRRIAGAWVDLFTFFVGINAATVTGETISPADASATWTVNSSASPCTVTQALNGGAATFINNWLLAGGTASDYAIRATLTSGTLTSGTTGSWLQLNASRAWNVTRTNNVAGTNSATMTMEMALWNGGAIGPVLDTAVVQLVARVDV